MNRPKETETILPKMNNTNNIVNNNINISNNDYNIANNIVLKEKNDNIQANFKQLQQYCFDQL